MTANTKIEWADHTFNPWIGCTKVSPACDHCYAEADFDKRRHIVTWGAGQPRKRTAPSTWAQPSRWEKQADAFFAVHGRRQRVFCASLADVFDNEVPADWRDELFWLITNTPSLDWLLLTKRIGNAEQMMHSAMAMIDPMAQIDTPLPNVWIGATICNQTEADRDISKLLAVPAAKRFLSIEPMLGPVDIPAALGNMPWTIGGGDAELHWVICGGESGPQARPMHPDWARSLRGQCQAAGVPFLFKQWGEWTPMPTDVEEMRVLPQIAPTAIVKPAGTVLTPWCSADGRPGDRVMAKVGKKAAGRMLDGRTWDEVPA